MRADGLWAQWAKRAEGQRCASPSAWRTSLACAVHPVPDLQIFRSPDLLPGAPPWPVQSTQSQTLPLEARRGNQGSCSCASCAHAGDCSPTAQPVHLPASLRPGERKSAKERQVWTGAACDPCPVNGRSQAPAHPLPVQPEVGPRSAKCLQLSGCRSPAHSKHGLLHSPPLVTATNRLVHRMHTALRWACQLFAMVAAMKASSLEPPHKQLLP